MLANYGVSTTLTTKKSGTDNLSVAEKAKHDIFVMIKDKKKTTESYVVLSMFKNTDLYIDSNVTLETFNVPVWKYYFTLLKKAVEKEIKVIDEISLGVIISEGGKELQDNYQKYGGWETIEQGKDLVIEDNFNSYLQELKKINAILSLVKVGFKIDTVDKFNNTMALTLEGIQEMAEKTIANCFTDIDDNEKVEDLSDGLWQVVLDANEELYRGFPYNSPLWNEYTNGMSLGNITMLSANSGVGKTFLTVAQVFPTFVAEGINEKLTILANEEDSRKWKQAIIVWVANNIYNGSFDKRRFNKGRFNTDELALLKKSTEWLKERMASKQIEFVAFSSFSMKKAIKVIRKQAITKDVKYFILDTLKSDSDSENEQIWLELQKNMVKLYDAIKSQTLNRHVFVTYQLGKSAMNKRYLDQSSLGVSKNVVDVVSTLLLARKALDSEKGDGGVQVREVGNESIVKYMNKEKDYFIIFIGKNRMGTTSQQMVVEVDMGKNTVTDFGFCKIEAEFSG